jgi:hypothetical protein
LVPDDGAVTPERPTLVKQKLADTPVDHAALARVRLMIGFGKGNTVRVQ